MKCLAKQGVFWGKHDVKSLQALVLLIYAMGHSQEPTWVLLGQYYLLVSLQMITRILGESERSFRFSDC
jgi:hypothetical protein